MKRWFTSDLHFGHLNIIAYCDRPFLSVEHMDTELVSRWNEVVAPDDEVYVLGDLLLGDFTTSLGYASQLHGKRFLVPGNHDRCWAGHRKGARQVAAYTQAGFEILGAQIALQLGRQAVTACHFPYQGDSTDRDRYGDHRPANKGQYLLHGHVHDAWLRKDRMINVGVDVWDFTPVSEDALIEMVGG